MRKAILVATLLGISSIVLVAIGSSGISQNATRNSLRKPKQILLGNKTHSLEVVKAEFSANGKVIRVAVKNISNKNIDWLRITLGANSAIEADFMLAEKPQLSPNDIYEDEYPFDADSDQVRITVLSVLFDDGLSDGDTHYAQLMKAKRAGEKMELNRLIPLLQRAAASSTTYQSSLLRTLQVDVDARNETTVPNGQLDPFTEARLIGIRTIRERVQSDLDRVKTKSDEKNAYKELKVMNEHYEKIRENFNRYELEK
jgi:hypothetical protein